MSADEHPTHAMLFDHYLGDAAALNEVEVEVGVDIDEHLFQCAACSEALEAIHITAASIVALVRKGEVSSGGTTTLVNRMARDRVNLRSYTIRPGETVACTVAANDDYMTGALVLPEDAATPIDMRVLDAQGTELARVNDIVVDARARQALLFIPARPVHDEGSALTQYVLVAPDQDDRELARYLMDHTSPRDG